MTAPSPDDLPGLVEAVADVFCDWCCDQPHESDQATVAVHGSEARAAVAAMVGHLGLAEETRHLEDGYDGQVWTEGFPTWPDISISRPATVQRRLVSRWREVRP